MHLKLGKYWDYYFAEITTISPILVSPVINRRREYYAKRY